MFLSSQVFCNKNKTILKEGDVLKFTKLAETMQVIAEKGAEVFYSGSVAQDLIKDIQDAGLVALTVRLVHAPGRCGTQSGKNEYDYTTLILPGGRMDMEDLKSFKVRTMDAWKVPLGEAVLHVAPPPAGGALLAFILRLMKGFRHLFKWFHFNDIIVFNFG